MSSIVEIVEKRLKELIPTRDETIFEAARYSLLGGGKRLRPLLLLATTAVYGTDPLCSIDPACAIEMIHTYSLIHDDLPCMDNDELRRGRPTLHKVYGEGIALLTGDYLLTFAFEVIANAPYLSIEQKLEMIRILSARSGSSGMIGGQVIDIEQVGQEIDEEMLIDMHKGKTSSLITACLEIGALVAGYPSTPLLRSIGHDLGLAYQFQDDLLDATSTTANLGKTAGADAAHKKPTAVSLFGATLVLEKLKELEKSIFEKLNQLPNQGMNLSLIIQQILKRTF